MERPQGAASRPWILLLLPLLAVALAARLALAVPPENFDSASYNLVASIVRDGGNVYAETDRYNYSPFWFLVLGGMQPIASVLQLPVANAARILLSGVDVATAVMLWRMAGPISAAVFFANPVSMAITGYHGGFDSIALLLVLIAVWADPRLKIMAAVMLAGMVADRPGAGHRRAPAPVQRPGARERQGRLVALGTIVVHHRGRDPVRGRRPAARHPGDHAGQCGDRRPLRGLFDVSVRAPHGGIFVLFAVSNILGYLISLVAGVLVGCAERLGAGQTELAVLAGEKRTRDEKSLKGSRRDWSRLPTK